MIFLNCTNSSTIKWNLYFSQLIRFTINKNFILILLNLITLHLISFNLHGQCISNNYDQDNDGICDHLDVCPNLNDNLIGTTCDDDNICTINDIWTADCKCEGTPQVDSDNDGNCDLVDLCPSFDDYLDIDKDDIPDCLDDCIDVNENQICDVNDANFLQDKLKIYVSHPRGYYDNSFNLSIFTNDPTATIKYSLDLNLPTPSYGNDFTNPIQISGNAIVKIVAYNSIDTTELKTYAYFFISELSANSNMSAHIMDDSNWAQQVEKAFHSLPVVSINSTVDFMSNADDNIHYPVSFEYFDFKTKENFQINSGISVYGNASRLNYPKKNYRLKFDSIYGDKNLKHDIFDGYDEGVKPIKKFDKLDLRSSHDSWFWSNTTWLKPNYFSTKLLDDLMKHNGAINPHSRHVHVFINSVYWGLYTLREKFDDNLLAEYEELNNDHYDFVSGSKSTINLFNIPGDLKDGTGVFWEDLVQNSTNYSVWKNSVNESNFFSFMIYYMIFYHEAEWNATGSNFSNEGFHFNINDADGMFTRVTSNNGNRANLVNSDGPRSMFKNLYESKQKD